MKCTKVPDGNVHVVPVGAPNPDHEEYDGCWCQPELAEDYTEDGGKKVYLHREVQ